MIAIPQIIQGGMGVGVSNWRLSREVSLHGGLGVVSGTALDTVLLRRLQLGDPGGHMRRALEAFPWPDMAQRILETYYVLGGKSPERPHALAPMPTLARTRTSEELLIVGNFVEVFLAKEGHDHPIGINYLEKIQLPTLPSLLGAMLGGVDCVVMGGGIPLAIPGALDQLVAWQPVELRIDVEDKPADREFFHRLDPASFSADRPADLRRPEFLAIVSSDVVAKAMLRRASGSVDGFVVEDSTAGGHNAPPRRAPRSAAGPSFGPRDVPNLEQIATLGRPFWLGGSRGSPQQLQEARDVGASGIQVGTIFAFCRESGIRADLKRSVLEQCAHGEAVSVTDFAASPTGYPFKVVNVDGTLSDPEVRDGRPRLCDMGYLRHLYCVGGDRLGDRPGNRIGYRCPAEPVKSYLAKGGELADTVAKQCLCNGLLATIGLGQWRDNGPELPIITSGLDFSCVTEMIAYASIDYTAKDVVAYLSS